MSQNTGRESQPSRVLSGAGWPKPSQLQIMAAAAAVFPERREGRSAFDFCQPALMAAKAAACLPCSSGCEAHPVAVKIAPAGVGFGQRTSQLARRDVAASGHRQ